MQLVFFFAPVQIFYFPGFEQNLKTNIHTKHQTKLKKKCAEWIMVLISVTLNCWNFGEIRHGVKWGLFLKPENIWFNFSWNTYTDLKKNSHNVYFNPYLNS